MNHTQRDRQILDIMERDPERGMELLIEAYTGLIWKVISFYLHNAEDMKDCVNDTFAEFYFCWDQYDPGRASLPVYLTAVARHVAISCHRKERRHGQAVQTFEPAVIDKGLELAEIQADLSRAMSALKPDELQIIRMKYYDGMTIREIADSLRLPYETVKKQHQRSLGKLRHTLLLMLLVLLLLALTACAYGILRYFEIIPGIRGVDFPIFSQITFDYKNDSSPRDLDGLPFTLPDILDQIKTAPKADVQAVQTDRSVAEAPVDAFSLPEDYTFVPGIGIKTDGGPAAYRLDAVVTTEDEETLLTLEEASYINGQLRVSLHVQSKKDPFLYSDFRSKEEEFSQHSPRVFYHGMLLSDYVSTLTLIDTHNLNYEVVISSFDPLFEEETIPLSLTAYQLSLPFALTPAEESSIAESIPYQMGEYGGLMIVPRLENGSLIIAIHPLDTGEYKTLPWLICDPITETMSDGIITATDACGNLLPGSCIRYRPFGSETYFEWDFGPASPGAYSLHIPFLYQTNAAALETILPIDLAAGTWDDAECRIPGGTVRIENCSPPVFVPLEERPDLTEADAEHYRDIHWELTLSYSSEREDHAIASIHPLLMIPFLGVQERNPHMDMGFSSIKKLDTDSQTILLEVASFSERMAFDSSYIIFNGYQSNTTSTVYYRWEQSFDFEFTVE